MAQEVEQVRKTEAKKGGSARRLGRGRSARTRARAVYSTKIWSTITCPSLS